MRGEHGIQHLHDGPLLGGGQRLDALELLRDLRLWPALARTALGIDADHAFDGGAQRIGERRQQRDPENRGQSRRIGVRVRCSCR